LAAKTNVATQKESRAQNKQMTIGGYISDTEDIVRASWSLFQHDGADTFQSSERSHLPPPLSAENFPGGRNEVLKVHRIRRINRYPDESDEDSAPERILSNEDWIHCNGD